MIMSCEVQSGTAKILSPSLFTSNAITLPLGVSPFVTGNTGVSFDGSPYSGT